MEGGSQHAVCERQGLTDKGEERLVCKGREGIDNEAAGRVLGVAHSSGSYSGYSENFSPCPTWSQWPLKNGLHYFFSGSLYTGRYQHVKVPAQEQRRAPRGSGMRETAADRPWF